MKNHAFKIQVPKPCHEDWNKMSPTEQGKFCASCEKEVVDLTLLSDRAIIQFFKHKKENTCGRLRPNQIDRNLNHYIKPGPSKSLLYTILFGGLAISQVTGQADVAPPITGNIEMVEPVAQGKISLHEKDIEKFTIITGSVFDATKQGLIGANVILKKNISIGTITDIYGNFELKIPKDQLKDMTPVLIFQYLGFFDKEVEITSATNLNITLQEEPFLLGEIVCVDTRPKHEKILDKIVAKIPVLRFKKKIRKKKTKAKFKKVSTKILNNKSKPSKQKTAVEKIETVSRIKVYPNPFYNEVRLTFTAPKNGSYKIEILSIDAKRVFKSYFTLPRGKNTPTIPLPSTLPSGKYILFLEGHGVKESEIIIKE